MATPDMMGKPKPGFGFNPIAHHVAAIDGGFNAFHEYRLPNLYVFLDENACESAAFQVTVRHEPVDVIVLHGVVVLVGFTFEYG